MISKQPAFRSQIIIGLLMAAALGACKPTPSTDKLLTDARQYQKKGDAKSTIIQLKNVLQQEPNNAEARYLLGVAYIESGDARSAEKELLKAKELGAAEGPVLTQLGRAYLALGQYQKTIDGVKPTEKLTPAETAAILTLRGNAYGGLRQLEQAKAAYQDALKRQPEYPDAQLGLARLAAMSGDLTGAQALVDNVITTAPKNVEARLMRGDIQRLSQQTELAAEAYNQALATDPGNLTALISLASLKIDKGDYDGAQKHVDEIKKKAPLSPLGNYNQALIHFKKKNFPAANDALGQVFSVAPDHLPSTLLAGATLYSLGSYQQAEAQLRKFLNAVPNNALARQVYAATLLKMKQPDRAIEILKPALAAAPENVELMALLANAYVQTRDFAKASEYFQRAATADPSNAALRTGLGYARLAMGEFGRATADLETAVTLEKDKHDAEVLLILLHLNKKQYDEALKAIAALEAKQPKNPITHNLMGAAYLGKQDKVKARAAFEKALALSPKFFPAIMNLAQMDIQENRVEAARNRFLAVLNEDKSNVGAMVALAKLSAKDKNITEAIAWLDKARKADTSAIGPRVILANFYLQTNQREKALAMAREAFELNPDDPAVMETMGVAQLANGQSSEALASFAKFTKAFPQSPVAWGRLAGAQIATRNPTGAEASLKKALAIQPNYQDAQMALILVMLDTKRYDAALSLASQIQSQNPKSATGRILRGDVLTASGKFPDAVRAYEEAQALSDTGTLAIKLHFARSKATSPSQADEKLNAWINSHPNDMQSRLYAAQNHLNAQRYPEATALYETVLKKEADNILALNNLAWLYQVQKDHRALATAERAYQINPNSAEVLDTLGWILVELGKFTRGLETLRSATALNPRDPQIAYHFAAALAKSGDKASARAQLKKLLADHKNFPQIKDAETLLNQL